MYYENFEKLCKAKNIKPATVSKETGISTATLSNWKKDNYTPKQDKLSIIADYFNVSVDYLMTGKEPEISDDMVLEEIELLDMYRKLTDEQKENINNIMKLFIKK